MRKRRAPLPQDDIGRIKLSTDGEGRHEHACPSPSDETLGDAPGRGFSSARRVVRPGTAKFGQTGTVRFATRLLPEIDDIVDIDVI